MNVEKLFWDLYRSPVEAEVEKVLTRYGLINAPGNWRPYGQNESNFGVVENQQAPRRSPRSSRKSRIASMRFSSAGALRRGH
jgi:hypothetical protein